MLRSNPTRRKAEHQRSRRLQPALDGEVDVVPRLDDPLIEPDAQPRRPQLPGQLPHARLIGVVMAEEDIV